MIPRLIIIMDPSQLYVFYLLLTEIATRNEIRKHGVKEGNREKLWLTLFLLCPHDHWWGNVSCLVQGRILGEFASVFCMCLFNMWMYTDIQVQKRANKDRKTECKYSAPILC